MIKKAIQVLTVCLLVAFMSSCQTQTQEEKVISKMQALAERIESEAETYDDEEWDNVIIEFEALQQQARECKFTAEQMKELIKIEIELTAAIDKHIAKKIGKDIKDAFYEGMKAMEGIYDGIKEGLDDGDEATEE